MVVCQNARRARTAVDREGFVLKDTFLAAVLMTGVPDYELEWLAMVMNSDVFHYIYEHIFGGTRKAGGHLHFLPGYLSGLYVPAAPEEGVVMELYSRMASGCGSMAEVEELVRDSYRLKPAELKAVCSYGYPQP